MAQINRVTVWVNGVLHVCCMNMMAYCMGTRPQVAHTAVSVSRVWGWFQAYLAPLTQYWYIANTPISHQTRHCPHAYISLHNKTRLCLSSWLPACLPVWILCAICTICAHCNYCNTSQWCQPLMTYAVWHADQCCIGEWLSDWVTRVSNFTLMHIWHAAWLHCYHPLQLHWG